MKATLCLDLRYLWIDRYCINQHCKEEVVEQVQKMDLIYQRAQLTIIACAGIDPTYGLPGVGHKHRSPQGRARIGKYSLISAMRNPHALIKSSKWYTRGWTYQESLLSRRRLVFTDDQVYFECYRMYCCEALDFSLETRQRANRFEGQKFIPPIDYENDGSIFPRGVGKGVWGLCRRIEEYTTKELTNPLDILNGMLGNMHSFEVGNDQIRHHWDTPVLPCDSEPGMTTAVGQAQWSPTTGLLCSLCWSLREPATRRNKFTSWSWTGWNGIVNWRSSEHVLSKQTTDDYVKVAVELADGRLVDWDLFEQSYKPLKKLSDSSIFLRISAWTTPIVLREHRQQYHPVHPHKYTASIEVEDASWSHILWTFTSTSSEMAMGTPCLAMNLSHHAMHYHESRVRTTVLVVREVDGCWERVGLGWIVENYGELYDSNHNRWHPDAAQGDFSFPDGMFFLPPLKLSKQWREIRLG